MKRGGSEPKRRSWTVTKQHMTIVYCIGIFVASWVLQLGGIRAVRGDLENGAITPWLIVAMITPALGVLLLMAFYRPVREQKTSSTEPTSCLPTPNSESGQRRISDSMMTRLQPSAADKRSPRRSTPAPGEIFVFGAIYINAVPESYLKLSRDFDRLRKLPGYLAIGEFSNPPQLLDLKDFTFDSEDIKALKDCKPGDCKIQMPASSIARSFINPWTCLLRTRKIR